MALLNLSEEGQIFRYALLTTKVVYAIQNFDEGKQLTQQEKETLHRGVDLVLKKIIEGATLVEGKKFKAGFSPSQEGLSVYGYALSTIEALNWANTDKYFTDFFEDLSRQLKIIIEKGEKKKVTDETVDSALLKKFFLVLESAFRSDILKERYTQPTEEGYPVLKKVHLNAVSFA